MQVLTSQQHVLICLVEQRNMWAYTVDNVFPVSIDDLAPVYARLHSNCLLLLSCMAFTSHVLYLVTRVVCLKVWLESCLVLWLPMHKLWSCIHRSWDGQQCNYELKTGQLCKMAQTHVPGQSNRQHIPGQLRMEPPIPKP